MNTIYIVPIEPIDQRYTKQWYSAIPNAINDATDKYKVVTIDGEQTSAGTTAGAFLDFAVTNVYKSSQIVAISKMFNEGVIKPYDKFLITDAWNYAVIAIRYMSDLLDIPVEIHGIWHAGAYDPTDILGMKMRKPWPWDFERSVYHALDYSYYATDFHKYMFLANLNIVNDGVKPIRSGQPHNIICTEMMKYANRPKDDMIMWPHRYNSDKQPEIAEDLAYSNTQNRWVITQKMNLSKDEYYNMLGASKAVFSCSLHENLGISMMEGVLAGAIPIVPDRASYREMYLDCFKYPASWTSSIYNFYNNRDNLIAFINDKIQNYDTYQEKLAKQKEILINDYLYANIMINKLVA
jgi:hypothetical protein